MINTTIYLALGLNTAGEKELLGPWIAEAEGAKFWLQVLTELRNRSASNILIACVDGLTGFPDAIESVFPKAKIQLCTVHIKHAADSSCKEAVSRFKRLFLASPMM